MHGGLRIIALGGFAAAPLAATQARAQTPPVITPSPTPAPGALPGVLPERFSIAPAPTPTPSAVPVPPPVAATPTPTPRATQAAPRSAPAARPAARETASPVAEVAPAPVTDDAAAPAPAVTPPPGPVATEAPPPAEERASGTFWPWLLGGALALALALAGLGRWAMLRRRSLGEVEGPEEAGPAEPPAPRAPPRPVAPPSGPAPEPARGDPFEIILNPLRIAFDAREVVLDCELLIGNSGGEPVENVRIGLAAMSANPQQDAVVTGFHRGPPAEPVGPPFDLAAGAGGRMPVRLALPRERVHVVMLGDRPMFVPMVLVDLRWRAGLGIRRFGAAFMLGTAGQGGKLGPVWLDRPAPAGPLAATRYFARAAIAA